ncbi:MAG TPA: AAA family ATPase [Candidatus Baltobacteraceae bacterium]|jgi:DNA-binding SARP family transcriptional activator/tetratricopeptide (TPR) repeat protein
MSRLVVQLFGTPSIQFDGQPIKLPTPARCVAVLATIALRRGEPPTRSTLAAAIWPDELDSNARANLRRHLHLVAQALPAIDDIEWLDTTARTIAWNVGAPAWFDVLEFEDRANDPKRREEAIALYNGDLLADWPDEFLIADRERLRTLYLTACFEAAIGARRDSRLSEALAYAERILTADEFREDALRLAMTVEYESGDRLGAVGRFQRFVDRLHAAMGVDPMPETLALRDALLSGVPASTRTPFVGRRAEMQVLEAAWRHAARGRGTVVFVGGDAGAGKTRLIGEICATVGAQGGRALYGETSNPQAYPYEPIVEALRRGISMIADSPPAMPWLSALSELLPELHARIAGIPPPKPLEPGDAQKRLFEAIERTIERLSRSRPLVLVLEDLHWAQAATLQALEALAARIAAVPVAIVATYRTGEVTPGHELHSLRRRLHNQRLATSIDVPPLLAGEVAELVAKIGASSSDEALSAAVYRGSEGNALFASLLLRNYAETGTLPSPGSAPRNIAETILERTSSLDASSHALLDAAAVAGRTFTAGVLAGALNWNESALFDALGVLLDRGFIRTSGSSAYAYAFSHALIEAAIYSNIPACERTARHRRIAELLESDDAGTGTLHSIARHWKAAGERARAAHAFAGAAEASLEVYARDEAIGYAREAIELQDDPQRKFEALSVLVRADEHYVSVERWNDDLVHLETVATCLGDAERYGAMEARARFYAQTGERERERTLIDKMLDLAGRMRWSDRIADALCSLGSVHVGIGDFRGAVAEFEQALVLAEALRDKRRILHVRQRLILTLMRCGDVATASRQLDLLRAERTGDEPISERMDMLWAESSVGTATEDPVILGRVGAELLDLATTINDRETEAKAHWLLGWAAMVGGDPASVRQEYEAAAALFEQLEQPQSLAATYTNLGVHYFEVGLFAQAVEFYRQAAACAERAGARNLVAFAWTNIGDARYAAGDVAGAREDAARGLELAGPTADQRCIAGALSVLGTIECGAGDTDSGLRRLRAAVDIRRTLLNTDSLMEDLCRFAEALFRAGRLEDAAGAAAELETLLAGASPLRTPPRLYATIAQIERAIGNGKSAGEYLARAEAIFQDQLAALPDEESREAFRALPHHRDFAGRAIVS